VAKLEYLVIIDPLPQDEGAGFVALLPDSVFRIAARCRSAP
jgi:hypothetical protein